MECKEKRPRRKWHIAWPALITGIALCAAPNANAAGLLIAEGGFGGQLQIKEHDVKVTINNGIAVTEVEQVFVNTENRVVEALYTFPVPAKASVSNFSMWIGGKEMVGEVVEKQRARQIYESYKQTRRDPGLLEQVDYKRFEMRIFPIPAGAEQRVRVTYCQELNSDHDAISYVYPLATTTNGLTDTRTTGKFAIALDVKSEVPIVELKSPSHKEQFAIAKHADSHYWQAALETREGDLNQDVVVNLQLERPTTGIDLITSKQTGEDGYLMLTLTAGKELEEKLTGSDYVFVLDVSGSMANDGKLGLSSGAVQAFVNALEPQDRFELITFNISANALFNQLRDVSESTKQDALAHLKSQRAMGGTTLRPAVEAAYRYQDPDRRLNVVVLSDGMTEQREQRELLALIGQRPSGSSVFCVGIGNEVNRPLLAQLAEGANGLAAFISTGDDFEQQALAFRRKLMRPAATNVKISFTGGGIYDVEPEKLANLFYGQPLRMYARYKQSGSTKVHIQAEIQGAPLDQTLDVNLPAEDASNPQIERMWASHRVDRLMRDMRETGSKGQIDEIVRLCEGYSIAGEYASFIVLENDGEYQRWKIERRNATRIERDRAAQQAVRQKLEQLRQETAQRVGPSNAGDSTKLTTAPRKQRVDVQASSPTVSPNPADISISSDPANIPDITSNSPVNRRGWDISVGGNRSGGGGGGAIDPLTAIVAAGLASLGWASRKSRRRDEA